jgi:coenzyme F420-reducing hydrogenase gamma subunit
MVARGIPCLGPVTQAGCGAICPAFGRGCYGCFGPVANPNLASLIAQLRRLGMTEPEVSRVFATFNAGSPALASAMSDPGRSSSHRLQTAAEFSVGSELSLSSPPGIAS